MKEFGNDYTDISPKEDKPCLQAYKKLPDNSYDYVEKREN